MHTRLTRTKQDGTFCINMKRLPYQGLHGLGCPLALKAVGRGSATQG
jgi:hypothetical protein